MGVVRNMPSSGYVMPGFWMPGLTPISSGSLLGPAAWRQLPKGLLPTNTTDAVSI